MIRHRVRNLTGDESGAVLVLLAVVMAVLLVGTALVIDIAAVRTLRINQQSISDAAAAAGALTAGEGGIPREVCEVTKAYVEINATEFAALSGMDCSAWSEAPCDPSVEAVASDTQNGITVRITYPVTDASSLMSSSAVGAVAQPASAEDGLDPCQRVGVEISSTWNTLFGRLAGVESVDATIHTVAKSNLPAGEGVPINLLVLDRTGCQTIRSSGNGGIYIDAIYDPDGDDDPSNGLQPLLQPGLAASDSDGSAGCGGSDGVIDIDGSNAVLRADGPEGCANQTGTHLMNGLTVGEGCGQIQTLAPGTPGCNFPACTFGGGSPPNPEPTRLPLRLTRALIDYRYNCKADYTTIPGSVAWATWALTPANSQDIPGCPDPQASHIDDLINLVGASGTPPGFQTWTGAGYPCTVEGPPGTTILVPAGNWHVNCPAFIVKRTVVFQGGNLVIDGPVDVESTAILAINANAGSYAPVDPEAWVVVRSGRFRKAGDAVLVMNNTFLYASKNAYVEMAGGNGRLTWVAPDQGDFDDLALWGDSPTTHLWAGQADLTLEGVFFTPFAQAEYAGTAGQNQVRAQFIAHSLHARGQGTLVVAPEFGRAVEFPTNLTTVLIR